ncbi:MAG TPA: enoyl-CoA hydratase, partial [Oceanicaulis sp.]|nr:enoyl-CoA hydratase [Oceanicaulis sp.]
GRAVGAEEALQIGLANRTCAKGKALETALELADQIAAFPQLCLRHDRRSALEQWSLDESAALINETRLGLQTLASGETVEGATRFTQGQGRHGQF